MKFVNSPTLRLAALFAVVAAATGCPSPSETETTVKPAPKKSTAATAKPTASTGTSSAASPSDTGSSAKPSASPTSTTTGNSPNPNGSSSPKASTSPTASSSPTGSASPTASTSPGASTSPSASPTASTSPSPTPTNPVATATPTPSPTATVAPANTGNVMSYAGRGQPGYIDAGIADAEFTAPSVLALQGTTVMYVGDAGDQRIRKIDLNSKQVSTVAGSGAAGFQNGIGRNATFGAIQGIAVDAAGNLYVSDGTNEVIRKIDMTDPGNPNVSTFVGAQGSVGLNNSTGTSAKFSNPAGIVLKGSVLYVADAGNRVIRAVDVNQKAVTTIAGSGTQGLSNGPGSVAQFDTPSVLALDKNGNLIVTDTGNHTIRRVSLSDGNYTVTTIAGAGVSGFTNGSGTGATFNGPDGATVGADGALYVADQVNQAIRRIDLNDASFPVSTFAGGNGAGYLDAQGTNARFKNPAGLVNLGNVIYVADPGNARVRVIQ